MRKVTTINLNNIAYQIDEDGYEALRRYLEDAEHALADNPDRPEIMADLEQAIGDKCRLALGPYKTVVGAVEIERILTAMGPVVGSNDDAAQPASGAGHAGAAGTTGVPPRPRRPYRILDGRQWTGVCSGLAAYAGVDVTWVRVAFVLLTIFTGGFWLIAYIALVFLMPIASTPEELAAAHGQPFNAQELVDRVKKKHQDFRAERRAKRHADRQGHWFAAAPVAPAVPQPQPGPAARVAGGVMVPVFTVLSAGWFACMAIAAFVVWHAYGPHGVRWPSPEGYFAELPRWIPLLAVIAIYVLLAMPIGAGRRTALYYANGGNRHGWADAWSGLLWIALVAILLVVAWRLLPELQQLLRDLLGPAPQRIWNASWIHH